MFVLIPMHWYGFSLFIRVLIQFINMDWIYFIFIYTYIYMDWFYDPNNTNM